MTYSEREAIFSKEVLSIKDIQALFDIPYPTAAELIRTIKFKLGGGRVPLLGKLHRQDYFEYFKLNPADYNKTEDWKNEI